MPSIQWSSMSSSLTSTEIEIHLKYGKCQTLKTDKHIQILVVSNSQTRPKLKLIVLITVTFHVHVLVEIDRLRV